MYIKKNVTKVKFILYTKDILVLNKMNYFSTIHLKFINKISYRKKKHCSTIYKINQTVSIERKKKGE